jgi:hypothetical protein
MKLRQVRHSAPRMDVIIGNTCEHSLVDRGILLPSTSLLKERKILRILRHLWAENAKKKTISW